MSANSTAVSKTKASTSGNTNGNGNAPKTKKGALDPNRLPDSGQDNANSSDIDTAQDTKTTSLDSKVENKEK
jgi:hypothetical protein